MRTKTSAGRFFLCITAIILLILADQFTKYAAISHLRGNAPVRVIPGILELVYVENSGISFGLFRNSAVLVSILSFVWIGVMGWFLFRILKKGGFTGLRAGLVLALAGAAGNLIDRLRWRYVVDFLYIACIRFPVFNVADILVVTGMILLAFLLIFIYREEELHAL